MNVEYLQSTDDLRRFKKQLHRRAARIKVEDSKVQVTRVGSLYRARLQGHSDSVLATTPSEAKERLKTILAMQSACLTKGCDLAADRAERAAARVVARVAKHSIKFDPKRG